MTYPYADPAERALAEAAARGLAGPPEPPDAMTMTEKGDSVAASCAAEIAQLERARCRVLEYGGGTSGEALGVVAVALSTVTKRTRRLRRALEHCRSAPGASRAVRP